MAATASTDSAATDTTTPAAGGRLAAISAMDLAGSARHQTDAPVGAKEPATLRERVDVRKDASGGVVATSAGQLGRTARMAAAISFSPRVPASLSHARRVGSSWVSQRA